MAALADLRVSFTLNGSAYGCIHRMFKKCLNGLHTGCTAKLNELNKALKKELEGGLSGVEREAKIGLS